MAVITSYATLQTAVADYLARSDLTSFVPNFVQNCEEKLYRELRLAFMEAGAIGTTTAAGVLAVPSDYLEMRYAYVNKTPIGWLERMTIEDIHSRFPNRSEASSVPRFYAKFGKPGGDFFTFGPAAASGVSIFFVYYAKLDLLRDDSDGINWLTTNAPDLLLYGSLLEAEPFIKNDPRIPVWRQLYMESLQLLKRQERKEQFSGGAIATRRA